MMAVDELVIQMAQGIGRESREEPIQLGGAAAISMKSIMLARSSPDLARVRASPWPVIYAPMNRTDAPAIEVVLPYDWAGARPIEDRNWHGQLHMWRMLDPYFVACFEEADLACFRVAVAVAQDWHRFHLVEKRATPLSWRDGMTGLRAMKVAALWELRSDIEGDPAWLDELWEAHVDWALVPGQLRPTNHGVIDSHGAMALAVVRPEHEKSAVLLGHIARRLPEILRAQFDEEGVHKENSPHYHFFVMRYLRMLLDAGWYDDIPEVRTCAEKTLEAARWLRLPDERYLPIGDSTSAPPKHIPVEPVRPHGPFVTFARSGYVIHRSDWAVPAERASYLGFMGAFQSVHHKHGDDLSFVWYEHGLDILTDSGKYAYADNEVAAYFRSSLAHNTLQIDDGQHLIRPQRVYGSAIRSVVERPWGIVIDAEVSHAPQGVTHRRVILYAPGQALVVVDRPSSALPHVYTPWFHLAPEITEVARDGDALQVPLPNGEQLLVLCRCTVPVELRLARGEGQPVMRGWASRGYADLTPAWTMGYSTAAAKAPTIATAFVLPGAEVRELAASDGGCRVAIGPIAESLHWEGEGSP